MTITTLINYSAANFSSVAKYILSCEGISEDTYAAPHNAVDAALYEYLAAAADEAHNVRSFKLNGKWEYSQGVASRNGVVGMLYFADPCETIEKFIPLHKAEKLLYWEQRSDEQRNRLMKAAAIYIDTVNMYQSIGI